MLFYLLKSPLRIPLPISFAAPAAAPFARLFFVSDDIPATPVLADDRFLNRPDALPAPVLPEASRF